MPSRMETSLRHVAMVAKFLDLNNLGPVNMTGKKTKKLSGMTFLCKIAHRNKTVAHSFFHRLTMQMAVSVKKDCSELEETLVHQ